MEDIEKCLDSECKKQKLEHPETGTMSREA
jgi:hypothetical protein